MLVPTFRAKDPDVSPQCPRFGADLARPSDSARCSKGHPTVDRQAGARHVAGLSARQVGDETGNLVGMADALNRDRWRYAIDVACRHVGERRPWLDVVHSD